MGKNNTKEKNTIVEKKNAEKNITEVVFILDRSGSMSGLEDDTIGGFNSMMKKQKKQKGEAYVTTVLFDDKIETLYDRENISKISKMTKEDYFVRGCTALLDAVGLTINHIAAVQADMPEMSRPNKTLFIITTDGMENASKEYTYDKVKKLVEQKKKKNWEFIFLGANIDAVSTAGKFGISSDRALNYECDSRGTKLNFKVLEKVVGCARASKSPAMMCSAIDEGACFDEIREDYAARHNKG